MRKWSVCGVMKWKAFCWTLLVQFSAFCPFISRQTVRPVPTSVWTINIPLENQITSLFCRFFQEDCLLAAVTIMHKIEQGQEEREVSKMMKAPFPPPPPCLQNSPESQKCTLWLFESKAEWSLREKLIFSELVSAGWALDWSSIHPFSFFVFLTFTHLNLLVCK